MKRFLSLFFWLVCLSLFGQTQTYIVATLTVTNWPTNGETIQINGHSREWTNLVTAASSQIQSTNAWNNQYPASALYAATNLWLAYVTYPETSPYLIVSFPSSNQLVLTGFPGNALTVATNGPPAGATNWITWTLATNTITNAMVLRGPTNAVGAYERTNAETYLCQYLGDLQGFAGPMNQSSPIWSEFLGTNFGKSLTNFILGLGTNCTNFTLQVGAACTNWTDLAGVSLTNYAGLLSTNASNYALVTLGAVWTNAFEAKGPGLSYLVGNNIVLTNVNGTVRFQANQGGSMFLYDYNGEVLWENDGSGNSYTLDDNGVERVIINDSGNAGGNTTGGTVLASSTGHTGFQISGTQDAIQTYSIINEWMAAMPVSVIGTATNFYSTAENSGTSATTADSFTVPAGALTQNGDSIVRDIYVSLPTTGSGRRIQVLFPASGGSTALIDTGSGGFSQSTAGYAEVKLTITYTGGTSYNYGGSVVNPNASISTISGGQQSTFNSGSGWAASSSFYIQLTSSSGSTGDLKILTDTITFNPGSAWARLP